MEEKKKYDYIYVSPHLDDAVFSASGSIIKNIQDNKSVLIITVFTEGKQNIGKNDCTNNNSNQYIEYYKKLVCSDNRKKEDSKIMNKLGVDYIYLNNPDILNRHIIINVLSMNVVQSNNNLIIKDMEFFKKYSMDLVIIFKKYYKKNTIIYFPLGSGNHPDHLLIHTIGMKINNKFNILFYEDMPYSFYPTHLKYRLKTNNISFQEVWKDSNNCSKLISRTTLLTPICFAYLYRSIRVKNNIKYLPVIVDFNKSIFDKKIDIIRLYKTQLEICFGTKDKKKIKKLYKKYSQNIKYPSKIKSLFVERYWKLIN